MRSIDEILHDLRDEVRRNLKGNIDVSEVEFEGADLAIYTREPKKFADNGDLVRNLAKKLRTRVVIRPDPSVLMEQDETIEKIKYIVPTDANISNYYFDLDTGEVLVEAEKPGIVIGKQGETLREITKYTGWVPKVVRSPPIESKTVKNIRNFMRSCIDERKDFLRSIGRTIHRDIAPRDNWIRVTTLGGCREVGRSCFLISTPDTRILVDCGVNVGSDDSGTPYLYVPEVTPLTQIDAVVVTHAHLDHSGLVPLLFKYGYKGPVYCTPPTRDLMSLLQIDYVAVAAKDGKPIPYDSAMVREMLKHTLTIDYGTVTDIAPDVKLTFHNAGHILGSSICHFHVGNGAHNVVITGDHKYEKSRLFDAAVNKFPRVETVFTESTYGGGKASQPPRKVAEKEFQKTIQETIKREGTVIIPAFAVGRSQEVMIVIEEGIRKGIIDNVPVYLDGMIWEATAIHASHPEYLNSDLRDMIFHKGSNPFLNECFKKVDSHTMRRKIIDEPQPCVILATAGMMNGGPVMEYFRAFAPEEKNCIIFVGYQAEGTMGQRIQKGWKEIPLPRNSQGNDNGSGTVKINLEIKTVDGFSGHSDKQQLLNYIRKMNPRPSFVLCEHGDEKSCTQFSSAIYSKLKIKSQAPKNLETFRLE